MLVTNGGFGAVYFGSGLVEFVSYIRDPQPFCRTCTELQCQPALRVLWLRSPVPVAASQSTVKGENPVDSSSLKHSSELNTS